MNEHTSAFGDKQMSDTLTLAAETREIGRAFV